ncbi:MAG: hypothetical protein V4671_14780 [Armatimonadota bacterium]
MNTRPVSTLFLSVVTITAALIASGCQGKTDSDTIGAAPPAPPNAKAPAPVTNKPAPAGGSDGLSGGGAAPSTTTEAAPVPASGN